MRFYEIKWVQSLTHSWSSHFYTSSQKSVRTLLLLNAFHSHHIKIMGGRQKSKGTLHSSTCPSSVISPSMSACPCQCQSRNCWTFIITFSQLNSTSQVLLKEKVVDYVHVPNMCILYTICIFYISHFELIRTQTNSLWLPWKFQFSILNQQENWDSWNMEQIFKNI